MKWISLNYLFVFVLLFFCVVLFVCSVHICPPQSWYANIPGHSDGRMPLLTTCHDIASQKNKALFLIYNFLNIARFLKFFHCWIMNFFLINFIHIFL